MPRGTVIQQAEALYFDPGGLLAEEPSRLIRDEGIAGTVPKGILDLVGRGVSKPSELASRLGTVQGNLTRPLAMLLSLGLLHRGLPFGESVRTTKRVLYSIQDPALSFYYGTYLPSRSRWNGLTRTEKQAILNRHVSQHWENFCRKAAPGSCRYWEAGVEIDLMGYPKMGKVPLVAECKWRALTPGQEKVALNDLRARFASTRLSRRFKKVDFRLFTPKDLARLSSEEPGA